MIDFDNTQFFYRSSYYHKMVNLTIKNASEIYKNENTENTENGSK